MGRKVLPLLALSVFCTTLHAGTPQEQIDRLFSKYDKKTSPGCMVAVIKNGEIVFKKGYGMADIDAKKAIDENTVFDLATLSRHFTGATAAWLIDNGAVRPTDNIRVTIPEMPRMDPPITIEDLIHHTSGLPDYISVWKNAGSGQVEDTLAMVDLLAQAKLGFVPGSRFKVSTSDYLLLGFVAQRVTSFSLAEWAQNVVLKPAGMVNSIFADHPEGVPAGAVGYRSKRFGGYARVTNPLPEVAGDIGLWTTIGDLAIWEKTLIEKKPGAPGFYKLLETTAETDDGQPINYVFGLDVGTYRGLKMFSHHGRANGFAAGLMRFPAQKLTIVCLSNLQSLRMDRMVNKVADLYLTED